MFVLLTNKSVPNYQVRICLTVISLITMSKSVHSNHRTIDSVAAASVRFFGLISDSFKKN